MDQANVYSLVMSSLFVVGVFACLLAIIWVLKSEGKQQRAHDSERMEDFKATTKTYSEVIANSIRETVNPLAQQIEATFEKVEEGLAITKTGLEESNIALTAVIQNQIEQKEAQAKELAIDMDTKNILEEVAKEIATLQAKVSVLETTSNQQFSDLKTSVATLQKDLSDMVQLVKAQLDKVKTE